MPSTTPSRKSSIGPSAGGLARRGPQKAHIPFRADDLEHGKKTGIAVTYVEHKSDEFEPFSEIMMQADGKTPVQQRKNGRKSTRMSVAMEEDGEEGEMSMELDHSKFLFIILVCILTYY